LKVNDASGNPIEVGASVVWQIKDTCRATFGVASAADYIRVQSEAALRMVVGAHPYDGADAGKTLRGNTREIAQELVAAIGVNVRLAGIRVIDAQIAHLAYAQEIASAMLKRQQAEQVIAAREVIVEGAVSMVKKAIDKLESEGIVKLEPADRVQLVCNLMTVLVGESEAQPVVQLGSRKY
jgi:regulator of protease activity HflC (stomatin/prohibitin superfamily)